MNPISHSANRVGLRAARKTWTPLALVCPFLGNDCLGQQLALVFIVFSGFGIVSGNQAFCADIPPAANGKAARLSTTAAPDPASTLALEQSRLFPEGLVSAGGLPQPVENVALAQAFRSYAASKDLRPLKAFVQTHPASPWNPSLLTNLGLLEFNEGYFSSALADWTQAWTLGKNATEPRACAVVNRAAAEAIKMYCRVGRIAEAKALLAQLDGRPLHGLSANMVGQSRQCIARMETHPANSFKCGPYALSNILTFRHLLTPRTNATLMGYTTTAQGTSLAQIDALARQLGLKMQPARRVSGTALPLPAVVNWKLNHYGALLQQKGDLYLLVDPTFGTSQWISADVVAQESSGYFLVPSDGPLPAGWTAVEPKEAGTVWGRGDSAVFDTNATGPSDPKSRCTSAVDAYGHPLPGMAVWDIHTSLASLNLEDIPLSYHPPVGPAVSFQLNYDHLEQNQTATLDYSNLGSLWNFSWVGFITFDGTTASYHNGLGGTEIFANYNSDQNSFDLEPKTGTRLVMVSATHYERQAVDGSKLVFDLAEPSGRVYLTQIVDVQGNALTMSYDANFRLVTVTDAIGQATTLAYASDTFGEPGFYLVAKVTDPFGRFTSLAYNSDDELISITDEIGLVSQFTYGDNDFIRTLTTPYGSTTFAYTTGNDPVRGLVTSLLATEPNGSQERLDTEETEPSEDNGAAAPAGMNVSPDYLLVYRNSFYWDRKAMKDAPGDVSKARLTHFLHLGSNEIVSSIIESTKNPLESRVWYDYQNNESYPYYTTPGIVANPTFIGQVMDDGSTKLTRHTYNAQSQPLQIIDPVGRTTNFTYADNGLDLLTIQQVNGQGSTDTLATYTWNTQHLPLTHTDAAGETTTYTYNPRGQLTSVTNPKSETTIYTYNAQGYLTAVNGPVAGTSDRMTFTYDAFGRLHTATTADGYVVTYAYDNLDRITSVTYPDGTTVQNAYTNLDLTQTKNRQGGVTKYTFNALREMTSLTDPLNRVFQYERCTCGALTRIIDPLNHTTAWTQDVMGRTTSKTYQDGSVDKYAYEASTSRLASVTDSRGQTKSYTYNTDDTLAAVVYLHAQQRTPDVLYTYDPAYRRVSTMSDGQGVTTFSYNPVTNSASPGTNRLAEIDTSWNHAKLTYSYDALGRVTNRVIDGVGQTTTFDSLGRAISVVNALGTFNSTFDAASDRLTQTALPNGQTFTATYFSNTGNRRLQQIKNLKPGGANLSEFDYTYNAPGEILTWNQQVDTNPSLNYSLDYDAADQLASAVAAGKNYAFAYDPAGNLLTRTLNGAMTNFTFNALNELQQAVPALGNDKTYLWDAENRLVGINYTGSALSTKLAYDGLGRCVEIDELNGATVTSTKRFVWSEQERCEERDESNNVTRRFFKQGEQIGGANYYYSFDHLGSVREMTDATGAVHARYDYDPYGVRTKVSGDLDASRCFTGQYYHAPSGLHLAPFRAYDAATARWISRDPAAEHDGFNLYAYVHNNPISHIDPSGTETELSYLARTNPTASPQQLQQKLQTAYDLARAFDGVYHLRDAFVTMFGGKSSTPDKFQTLSVADYGNLQVNDRPESYLPSVIHGVLPGYGFGIHSDYLDAETWDVTDEGFDPVDQYDNERNWLLSRPGKECRYQDGVLVYDSDFPGPSAVTFPAPTH